MISSSCSTTRTVFPIFFKSIRIFISFSVSLGCNPILGSSSTYKELTKELPKEFARLIRCDSPPDKVLDFLLIVKYPRPTLHIKVNLFLISLIILSASFFS